MKELIQKSLIFHNKYLIEDDRVTIRKKGIGEYEEYFLRFEQLGFDVHRKKTAHQLWSVPFMYGLAILSAFGAFLGESDPPALPYILALSAILFAGIGTYILLESGEKIYIAGGNYGIMLEKSLPSEETVQQFIAELHAAMRDYFRKEFAVVHPFFDKEEQARNFYWLLSIRAISKDEYDELLEELRIRDLFH